MEGRQTRGRQRIPISRIQNQDDLYATFSKRRHGLYKKASQLCTQCGVDMGIIIFSPTNVPYSFFHPNMDSVVERYRNPDQPRDSYTRAVESATRSRIEALNKSLDEILDEKQQLKEKNKHLEEIERTRQKGWWEEIPIESLNKEQVEERIAWFQAFKAQVQSRIEQLQNGASTSTANPQNLTDVAGPSTRVSPSISAHDPLFTPAMGIEKFLSHGAHNPSFASGSDHVSGQYFLSRDPSSTGGSGHIPDMYFSPSLFQDPLVGGGSDFTPISQDLPGIGHGFFLPAPPLNSSTSDGSTNPFPEQYRYIPPQTRDFSATGESEDDGPSHQGKGGN